ncbi:hypothetical protein PAL_GLEAN10004829 [Pteropus alecto]|uniref:Uncharacterized protein n=1 Tax=Pteropus alecto TaxID=9402 RepID=L5KWC2_PTEAL|nr:hypothetical protein PAL_GLEAN10004829 [Pteropus alecto]
MDGYPTPQYHDSTQPHCPDDMGWLGSCFRKVVSHSWTTSEVVIVITWDPLWRNKVYWMGPMLGTNIAGLSFKFLFSSDASRDKLVAFMTCHYTKMVDLTSVTHSAFSTTTQPPPLGSKFINQA